MSPTTRALQYPESRSVRRGRRSVRVLDVPTFLDGCGTPTRRPEEECEDQSEYADHHEDPTDHTQIDPRDRDVHREGEDRAHRDQEDARTDTHGISPPVPPNRPPRT